MTVASDFFFVQLQKQEIETKNTGKQ